MARFIQQCLSRPLNDALCDHCGQGGFPAEPRGWQGGVTPALQRLHSSGDTGGVTPASGAGGPDTDFSPLSVKLLKLNSERKVKPSLPTQPTAHDCQQWKMHLSGVSGGTVSFQKLWEQSPLQMWVRIPWIKEKTDLSSATGVCTTSLLLHYWVATSNERRGPSEVLQTWKDWQLILGDSRALLK